MSDQRSTRKPLESRNSSRETLCSSNPSSLLHKRKAPIHPLAASIRINATKNTVQQRVLSAKILKLKQLQNQLNDANNHITELLQENRSLKTLQARHEKALSKYEGTNSELPKVLTSYEEEIRVLQVKHKNFRKGLKEAGDLLKIKDEEINNLREQLKHLTNLSKDKQLEDRQKLSEQIEELKRQLQKNEDEIKNLNRKNVLDSRNFKNKLNNEISKTKQYQKELQQAFNEIDKLHLLMEGKVKHSIPTVQPKRRFESLQKRQSVSMVCLERDATTVSDTQVNNEANNLDETPCLESKENVKLQPIVNGKNDEKLIPTKQNNYLEHPSTKIKARLSGENLETSKIPTYNRYNYNYSEKNGKKETTEKSLQNLGKLTMTENEIENLTSKHKDDEEMNNTASQIQKEKNKLMLLGDNLKSSIRKGVQLKDKYALDENLENYCSSVITSVNKNYDSLEKHLLNFENNKTNMDKILTELEKVDKINQKLTAGNLNDVDIIDDSDILNEILKEEFKFQKEVKKDCETANKYDLLIASSTKLKSHTISSVSDVGQEDKRKLLDKLKAIDNQEDVGFPEEVGQKSLKKSNLMKELFGQINN